MSAAETINTTVEQFTVAGNQAFKDAMEKTLAAINEASAFSRQNVEAVIASATAAAKGAETLGAQTAAFAKTSVENQVAAAKSLAAAKSVQEVIELQTNYARTALETYLAELNRWGETVTASMKDSVQPINERVTAAVEKFQAAR
ncbi:MAG: TIGR01841 family phasin [Phenylobacterium sp.]|jgi:phasin family protein|uniref:phasin family protein n=1 Tax=Phenylobacterium sp. TaxID=1871053 RepID=UPI002A32C804|nr:TIGR01841 family phasin [Phenylobacterium sp.]MDD3838183.1 TIGR01841 family phasin [Phenylobacterium sp.]MDX9996650.1 TIGR01841 family phasin [Phenylobacterium sp.]